MLTLIKNGIEYSLDDGTLCYKLGDDGWGAAQVSRITERGPQQHGETDHGYRLQPRVANLILGVSGTSLSNLYAKRNDIIALFGPDDSLILRWDDLDRQIDVYFVGNLTMPSSEREGFFQTVAVTLRAPDPTFYTPTRHLVSFGLGGGGGAFTVPMPVPHAVGASTLDETVGIEYDGSWLDYPVIRITGPITDPKITNVSTGDVLDFTGTTVSAGDWYEIDTRYGYKTVVDDASVNKIADLTEDSDLATFHIRMDSSEVPGGNNSIKVEGSAISTATKVELWYYERYLGI